MNFCYVNYANKSEVKWSDYFYLCELKYDYDFKVNSSMVIFINHVVSDQSKERII